jgi:alcohol dehydrogenase
MTAQFYSPSEIIMVDLDDHRLEFAQKLGATAIVNSKSGNATAVNSILDMTGGRGVDVAIEAVGVPATFDICQQIIAPGGKISNVGVHGKSVELKLQDLWSKNITIRTRLVDTENTPLLLKLLLKGKLKPESLVTHRFKLSEIMQAYDTFGNAQNNHAIKLIINHE